MRILWLLPILGAVAASFILLLTFTMTKGAPQEAAGAALACAVAIIPYVLCKALIGLFSQTPGARADRIVAAIERGQRSSGPTPMADNITGNAIRD